ncbi:hypothetical protein Bbelb_407520 [Branchiostoma belcheri]|nr:hypothetical protein Bbelb_407520 [Branchiostoma belcheri]
MAVPQVLMLLFLWRLICNRGRRRNQRAVIERRQRQRRLLYLGLAVAQVMHAATVVDRAIWERDRSKNWWDETVVGTFTDADWQENFRVSRLTFDYLCDKLRARLQRRRKMKRRIPVPVEKRVAVALWYLATGCGYRTLGHLFGVAKSTVCEFVHEVCRAIVHELKKQYIRIPKGQHLREVVETFEDKWQFPQCAGAIDGTHVQVIAPQQHHTDYFNRKGFHSVILQAVVDPLYRFININVGWPGSVHDARVLKNSGIFARANAGNLFPNDTTEVNGVPVPIMLLGDPAYPLLSWLMKGYPEGGQLTNRQKHFNYRLSRARMVVECAFGRLKGRWRCLLKRMDVNIYAVPDIVSAACVLHNLCEMNGEFFNNGWLEETGNNPVRPPPYNGAGNAGARPSAVRDALALLFEQQDN